MSDELPEGWVATNLGRLTEYITSGSRGWAQYYADSGALFLRVGNLDRNTIRLDLSDVQRVAPPPGAEGERTRVRPGDVLVSITADVGMVGVVPEDFRDQAYVNQHVALCRPVDTRLSKYIGYALNDPKGLQRIVGEFQYGQTKPGLHLGQVRDLELPLPPMAEQQRIVTQVEALLGQVNRAKGRLNRIPLILKRFRQAVLAAACSGELTEEWRGRRAPFLPHHDVDVSGLPDLPEFPDEWGFGPLEAFTVRFQYGTSVKADADETTGVPVLRMGNIQDGSLDLGDLKYIKSSHQLDPFLVKPGDVLFNRTNSPELVGKTAIVTATRPMTFASYIVRAQLKDQHLRPEFASWWLNSGWGRAWARHVRTDGVSQSNINATKLAAMPIPVPSLEEQDDAIRRGTKLLFLADSIERSVGAASAQTDRLPQAILSKAFSGQLVPTEAELARAEGRTYETADELLARVERKRESGAGAEGTGVRQSFRGGSRGHRKRSAP